MSEGSQWFRHVQNEGSKVFKEIHSTRNYMNYMDLFHNVLNVGSKEKGPKGFSKVQKGSNRD